jgi:hypothetical protein
MHFGHRVVGKFLGGTASLGMIQLPAVGSFLYLIITQPTAAAFVRDQLYEFW